MRGASEGWRAGDLAVCLQGGWWCITDYSAAAGPDKGQIVRVHAVFYGVDFDGPQGVALEFDEFPKEVYPASKFRRIEPDHSAADDAEIVALIKRASVRASA